jgi:ubiquinone/menaquinone biosynthesis C-methylase UbiE
VPRAELPLPPKELMARVGREPSGDLEAAYLSTGSALKSGVVDLLGPGWSWEGRRVLDFGCGSGRLLRQFNDEARMAEFHGTDIDEEMIAWVRAQLCPPMAGAGVNAAQPPLDFPDDQFDLVIALSVFTHIAVGWSDWLLELRRVLRPGGLLIATFLDSSYGRTLTSLPWDEERVGMSVLGFADPETPWPNVLHSHWWLREHWGRAFEIVELRPGGELPNQGWALLRPREGELTPELLERENPDDRRYGEAHRFQLELLRAEGEELKRHHQGLVESASWRLTAPFRRVKTRLNRR